MNSQLSSKQLTAVAGGIVGAIALISGGVILFKKKASDSSLESVKVQDEELAQRLQQDEQQLQEDRQRLQEDEKRVEEDRRLAEQLQNQQIVQSTEIDQSNVVDDSSSVESELSQPVSNVEVVHSEQPINLPEREPAASVVELGQPVSNVEVVHSEQPINLPEREPAASVAELGQPVSNIEIVQPEQQSNVPGGVPPPAYSSVQSIDPTQRPPGGGTRKNKITKKKSRKHYAILQKVKELLKEI
jgi:hypothetical protein